MQASRSTTSTRPPTRDRTNALPSNAPHLHIHDTTVRWVTAVIAIITSCGPLGKLRHKHCGVTEPASAKLWVTGVQGRPGPGQLFARVHTGAVYRPGSTAWRYPQLGPGGPIEPDKCPGPAVDKAVETVDRPG
jgi:hypothetical protein